MNAQVRPDVIATVFAGVDIDATQRVRSYFGEDYQPSSPSFALLKEGEVVHFVHRHQIEGRSAESVATELVQAFERARRRTEAVQTGGCRAAAPPSQCVSNGLTAKPGKRSAR